MTSLLGVVTGAAEHMSDHEAGCDPSHCNIFCFTHFLLSLDAYLHQANGRLMKTSSLANDGAVGLAHGNQKLMPGCQPDVHF